jgi:autotransporter-associated beta strand protein
LNTLITVNEGSLTSRSGSVNDGNGGTIGVGETITITTNFGSVTPTSVVGASSLGGITWSWTPPDGVVPPVNTVINIDFTDVDGTTTVTFPVKVSNVAPTVTAPSNQFAIAGKPMNFNIGSFTDPGAIDNPWNVQIDWDYDGATFTNDTTFSLAATGSLGKQANTYVSAKTYTVGVRVTDKDTAVSSIQTFTVQVDSTLATTYASSAFASASPGDIVDLDPGPAVANGIFGYDAWSTVDNARQVTSTGGTLNVLQGSNTTESVTFSKAVTLQRYDGGATPGTATITGLQTFSAASTVNGLTLVGGVTTSADLTLNNNTISNSGSTAVTVSGGTTTLTGNTIQTANTGIVAASGSTVVVNTGTISNTVVFGLNLQSGSTGSILGGTITASNYGVYNKGITTFTGGTISNAAIGFYNDAGGTVTLNGGSISNSNYGVYVPGGTANFSAGTITGASEAVFVLGGIANITGGSITANTKGIYFLDGTASVGGVSFARGGGSANLTDIYLDKSTGFTFNTGIIFDASDLYINNQTSTAYDLTAKSPTFKNDTVTYSYATAASTDNFRIEDRIYHVTDDPIMGKVTWVAGNTYITAPGTGTTSDDSSIQNGVDISNSGDTVRVEAGTFAEYVSVNTNNLTLLGAQAGVDARSRSATETIITSPDNVLGAGIVTINANTVTFDGFTVDGDNTALSSGKLLIGGVLKSEANWGIIVDGNDSLVQNNRVLNTLRRGLLYGDLGIPSGGQAFQNLISGIGSDDITVADDQGQAVQSNNGDVDFIDNKIQNTHNGLLIRQSSIATTPIILSGNNVTGWFAGIGINETAAALPAIQLTNNTVSTTKSGAVGLQLWSIGTTNGLTTSGNTFSGAGTNDIGIYAWNGLSSNPMVITVTGGSVTGYATSVLVANDDTILPAGPANSATTLTLSGVSLTPATGGTAVSVLDTATGTEDVTVNLTGGTSIAGSASGTGVRLDGPLAFLSGDTLGTTPFTGFSGTSNYVVLANGAYGSGTPDAPLAIDGTSASYNGVSGGGTLTTAQAFAIEDRISDYLDKTNANTIGFVRLKSGNIYVTQNSNSIQRGVNAASSGDTVNVQAGTFAEQVTINKPLTLLGSGKASGTRIVAPTGFTANTPLITVAASNVTLDSLQTEGQGTNPNVDGISLASGASFIAINNVTTSLNRYGIVIDNSGTAVSKVNLTNVLSSGNGNGFAITSTGKVDYLSITSSNFDGNTFGFTTEADSSRTNNEIDVTNVTIGGTTFNNNASRGIRVQKLANAELGATGNPITVNNSGSNLAAVLAAGSTFGAGIDVDLRFGTYTNLAIRASVDNSGVAGTVPSTTPGYAVIVTARSANSASLSTLALDGLTVTDATAANTYALQVSRAITGINFNNVSLAGASGLGLRVFGLPTGTLSLGNTQFDANLTQYISQEVSGLTLDATGSKFGGVNAGATLTAANAYAIVDKITDVVDVSGIGKVNLKNANAYVTPNSFTGSPGTTTPDIQRAIDSLGASGGTVNIQGGSYTGNVSTSAGSFTLVPGTDGPASVSITGDLTLDSNDTLAVDLNGTTAGTQYDQFAVTGNATLGSATVSATLGYSPALADQFTLVTAATLTGTFSNTVPFTVGTTKLYPTYYSTSAKLTATPVALPLTVYADDSYTGSEQTGEVVAFPAGGSASAPYVYGYNTSNTIAGAQGLLDTGTTTVRVADGTYTEAVTIAANQTLIVNNGNVTANSLAGGATSTLNLNSNDFTYGDANDVTFNGVFVGTGTSSVIKQGTGKSTLTGDSSGYTGNFDINGGTLLLDTSTTKLGGAVNVGTSGTLTGSGQVGGLLTNNGTVSPGNLGAGTLTALAGYTQSSTGSLVVEYTGTNGNMAPVAGTDYDQLAVTGAVNLAGTLSFDGSGNAPANFKGLTFIANDSTDAIVGTFTGKTGGTVYNFGGSNLYLVTYAGDSGNDFLLLKVNTAGSLTPVYVDDSWASLPGGAAVTTPDGTAYVSFNAFGTLAGGLGKQSTGGLIDVSSGTYAGGVSLTTGTIRLRNNPSDPSPNGVVITGTLSTDAGTTLNLNRVPLTVNGGTITGVITGVGSTSSLTNASGTLTLNNTANSYKGSTTVTGGSLTLGTDEVIPDGSPVVVNGGSLNLAGYVETIGSLEGTGGSVALGTGGELATGGNGRSGTYAGVISGSGSVIKDGAGILTLSGTNTYTGTTTINAGTLQLGNNGTSGVINTPVAVGAGASLAFNRSDIATQDTLLGTGNGISGDGWVSQNGSGGSQLTTGVNTYKGGTVINKGTLTVLADANLGDVGTAAGVFINNAGRMVIASDITTSRPVTMSTLSGSISVNSGKTLTLNATSVTGGMLRGDGTIVLQGGTTVDSTTILNGTTVKTTGSASLTNINNFGTVNVQAASTATINNFTNGPIATFLVNGTANAQAFTSTGMATINGTFTNTGTSDLILGNGSTTVVNGTLNNGLSDIRVNSGLLTNNGTIDDLGNTRTLFIDFGSIYFQNGSENIDVVFQNGGQAGS